MPHNNDILEIDSLLTTQTMTTFLLTFRGYISPVLFGIGVISNLFTIITFLRMPHRTRFAVYSIALAIAQIWILITNTFIDDFLGRGLQYASNGKYYYKVDKLSQGACKILEYLPNAMYFVCSYLHVVFSLDRLLTLLKPLKFSSIFYKQQAVLISTSVYLVGLLAMSPLLIVYMLETDPLSLEFGKCVLDSLHWPHLESAFIIVKVYVIFCLPVCVISLCNAGIIVIIWQAYRKRELLDQRATSTQATPSKSPNSPRINQSNAQSETGRVAGHLGISTLFLLLYLPLVASLVHRHHLELKYVGEDNEHMGRSVLLTKLLSSVKDITYCFSFFIYLIFLGNFREAFLKMFRKAS